jgi:phosphoribosyl 1,2-cyclic phosphate phosphodiesterase
MIGCDCAVCTSGRPRNQRLRCGLSIDDGETVVLVDTPTDLRQQALEFGVTRVDAVAYTHAHADHILGLDELRIYNLRQRAEIPCYGKPEVLDKLGRSFHYIFEEDRSASFRPRLELRPVTGPFRVGRLEFEPIRVFHGELEIFGYRIGDLAYLTDCSAIPEGELAQLEGLEILILGALRYTPHPNHFTVEQALEAAARIGARRTVFTHMSHEIDYYAPALELPDGVGFAHDGQRFRLG